jgi:hypothetical protein
MLSFELHHIWLSYLPNRDIPRSVSVSPSPGHFVQTDTVIITITISTNDSAMALSSLEGLWLEGTTSKLMSKVEADVGCCEISAGYALASWASVRLFALLESRFYLTLGLSITHMLDAGI